MRMLGGPHPYALNRSHDDESFNSPSLIALFLLSVPFGVLIFNWRVFLAYFSRTGVKTIVMVVVSLLVVYALTSTLSQN